MKKWADIDSFLTLIRDAGNQPVAVATFIGCYLIGTSLFLPAVSFHIVAGLAWGFARGVAISQLALNLVSNLQFWVGRKLGQARVSRWLARRGLSKVESLVQANGIWGMVVVRQLPLPFVGVNVAAGASPIRWWHFAVGSSLGALGPTLVYTYFASQLYQGVAGAKGEVTVKALLAGGAIVLLAVSPKLVGWMRGRFGRGGGSIATSGETPANPKSTDRERTDPARPDQTSPR